MRPDEDPVPNPLACSIFIHFIVALSSSKKAAKAAVASCSQEQTKRVSRELIVANERANRVLARGTPFLPFMFVLATHDWLQRQRSSQFHLV